MAQLCSHAVHDLLVSSLVNAFLAVPPAGFGHVALGQLRRAGQAAFRLMAEATRDGVRPQAGGPPPLEAALRT
eukprot:10089260-Lingulodinium_polyedra.AAC.1